MAFACIPGRCGRGQPRSNPLASHAFQFAAWEILLDNGKREEHKSKHQMAKVKDKKHVSSWFRMFALFITALPCIGVVMIPVWAFVGDNESRKNYLIARTCTASHTGRSPVTLKILIRQLRLCYTAS